MNNKVTILVNSCDKYEDAWEPFFRLLKIQWPECENYKIVLSTESKQYNCDFLDVKTINIEENMSWSARLKNALEKIDTKYVLFFLEDFFLLEKVRDDIFNKALELMERDSEIGLITFNKRRFGSQFPEEVDHDRCFYKVKKSVTNRTNVLVGLWRKEYYLKLIFGDENPWEYEKNSNIRSRYAGWKIYSQDYKYSPAAFRYCMNPVDGYGITYGKWLNKNKELFEAHGIYNVDYDNLGVFEETVTYEDFSGKKTKNKVNIKNAAFKDEKLKVRLKESVYILYKNFKKTGFIKKISHCKICFKYFIYYKLNYKK